MTTRVGTPRGRAAATGNNTSEPLSARLLRQGPTYPCTSRDDRRRLILQAGCRTQFSRRQAGVLAGLEDAERFVEVEVEVDATTGTIDRRDDSIGDGTASSTAVGSGTVWVPSTDRFLDRLDVDDATVWRLPG